MSEQSSITALVDSGMSEEEAKRLFDRFEPRLPLEQRHLLLMEKIRSVKAEVAARG